MKIHSLKGVCHEILYPRFFMICGDTCNLLRDYQTKKFTRTKKSVFKKRVKI